MAESIVSDWLAEYERIEDSPTEVQTFIAEHENNHEVSSAIFSIINERLKYPDVSKRNIEHGQFSQTTPKWPIKTVLKCPLSHF